jgi:hypothetical protein
MRSVRWHAAIAAVGVAGTALLPMSPALSPGEITQARLITALLIVAVCTACTLARGGRPAVWTAAAVGAAAIGLGLLGIYADANSRCLATYDGRPHLIGGVYTPSAAEYALKNPGLSPSDLLLDAGGTAERIWTSGSIASCHFRIGWAGLLTLPFVAAAISALVVRRGFRFAAAAPRAAAALAPTPTASVYDAFLSYRHAEPDRTNTSEILEALESNGLRVAIDFRDFAPNQHFLSEMERCIKESRFVLCVITPRYLDSDHCSEEAIICKTLDLADRRKRLVPLVFERVELPIWLHGLVGVDFSGASPIDPVDRLLTLLKATAVR